MKIKCGECGTSYNIPDSKIPNKLSTAKCKKCNNTIPIQPASPTASSRTSHKSCPKCGYKRKDSDIAPPYECPECGIIYSKYGKKSNNSNNNESEDKIDTSQNNFRQNSHEESKSRKENSNHIKDDNAFNLDNKPTLSLNKKLILLAVFAVVFYSMFSKYFIDYDAELTNIKAETELNNKSNNSVNSKPKKKSWNTFESEDTMTGKFEAYTYSPTTYPKQKMSFPYSDVNSFIGIGCKKGSDWAYFKFSTAPNLTNDTNEDGYSLIKARIKWDEQLENITLYQKWGSKSLIVWGDDAAAISRIAYSKKVLLELQWHGESSTYFEYSTEGARDAIAEIRAKCN